MKRLIILGGTRPDCGKKDFASQAGGNDLIARWEGPPLREGEISISEKLREWLLEIRGEHMRWAYEMGKLPCSGKNLAEILQCGDELSMWWTSLLYERHPKLSPELYPLYKLRCVERLLDDISASSLVINGGNAVLRDSLRALCAAKHIAFTHEGADDPERDDSSFARRIYDWLPAPLRAMARFSHWLWAIKRHLPHLRRDAPGWEGRHGAGPTASISTYFPNIDLVAAGNGNFRSRYWEALHDALNREAKRENPEGPHFVRWLFIRFPSPQLSFAQCLKLRNLFQSKGRDGLSFNYLEEFLSAKDILAAIRRWLALCRRSRAIESQVAGASRFSGSVFNFWPLIRGQWRESMRGWRCLERCLQNIAFRNFSARAGKQRWHLFPLENCPWERMLTTAARRQDTPVYGAQHSIIRPTDFRYFDDPREFSDPACSFFQPDIICGNGHSALSQWFDNGLPKKRLLQIEALRYLYLDTRTRQNSSNIPPEPGEPLEPAAARRLLVLTSFFRDETQAHMALLKHALDAGLLADWQITIKPHPYLSVADWVEALPPEQRRGVRITDEPITMALRPGIGVWASNSTTAALEAALKGLPLLVMLPHGDFDLCPIQDIPGLLRTGTLENVAHGLKNMRPLKIPPYYLDLDKKLTAWKKLLGLGQ